MSTMPTEISQALAKAQAEAREVAKRSRNTQHNYNYASAEDVIATARDALACASLALIPLSTKFRLAEGGMEANAGAIGYLDISYRLVHGPTGQVHDIALEEPVCPTPSKNGGWARPLDKAAFAARTEGLGYMLRELLLIPRRDAVDISGRGDDDDDEPRNGRAQQQPAVRLQSDDPRTVEAAEQEAIRRLRAATDKSREEVGQDVRAMLERVCIANGLPEAEFNQVCARVKAAVRPARPTPPSPSSPSAPADGVPPVLVPEAPADHQGDASVAAKIVAEAQKLTKADHASLEQISVGIQTINALKGLSPATRDARLADIAAVRARLLRSATR